MDYVKEKHPDLYPLYEKIYMKKDRSYFEELEKEAEQLAKDNDCPFVDNETPYGRAEKGHPVIVNYFYHEEVRGSNNTGKRNKSTDIRNCKLACLSKESLYICPVLKEQK